MSLVYYKTKSPANSSRAFSTHKEAESQPQAFINLELDLGNRIIVNSKFNSDLICYDSNYNTSDDSHLRETLHYLEPIINHLLPKLVLEIGCGQGELVKALDSKAIKSIGFDPTLKEQSTILFKEYFKVDKSNSSNDESILFVMRCVLPHIQSPFTYLNNLMDQYPNSKVLIEFQDLKYTLSNKLWVNFSHDHVNYFSHSSFRYEYQVLYSGSFAGGEWGFVVLNGRKDQKFKFTPKKNILLSYKFQKTRNFKKKQLSRLKTSKKDIYIYGAAGKGTQLCHELKLLGFRNLHVIDQNKNKHNLFIESSGFQIISLDTAKEKMTANSIILVVNPRHLDFVMLNFPECQVKNFKDI